MILIRNGELFAPRALGKGDLLAGGGKILAVAKSIQPAALPGTVDVIDAGGLAVVPGFIDGHQHFTGGGGEGGFHTRTPEMQLSMNTTNGVTTAVGVLGTDALTRSVESLYAKTQSFNAEGLTAFMLTGSYWHPSPTLTGSVARDLVYLQPVIGCKLALSDIRGPHIEASGLAALAADIRVAALVAAKPGIITVHTGVRPTGLDLIFEVVRNHFTRADMFIPTHINRRDPRLTDQVLELARLGATVDATCMNSLPAGDSPHRSAADFACLADENGLFDRVSLSSDAGGSLPVWNEDRSRIVSMGIGTPASLLFELSSLVNTKGMPLDKALRPLTTTPARVYGLAGAKGELRPGADADILVLDPARMAVRDAVARGAVMVRGGSVERKGYFE
ncbi:MAG: amidohydrolase family protein [Desulfobacterales bacterium]|jgi:beta-aspartyl-dipeptidase (metallo-type)|nr:amidohydrolase family protein [Desulfobacterales bacterium]